MVTDPRNYRGLCYRGEGRANFVISAVNQRTGVRIVWRISKKRKSGMVTIKAKSELVNTYMNKQIAPLFDRKFLVSAKIIEFSIDDAFQLAKIPSDRRRCFQTFEELCAWTEGRSFLPMDKVPSGVLQLSALEMLDATQIPRELQSIADDSTSVITVEVKPKQGFVHSVDSKPLFHFCNNCVLQIEKCTSSAATFSTMYGFCPLQLYSGVLADMRHSISALINEPHRNLIVWLGGEVVHALDEHRRWDELDAKLSRDASATLESLVDALCCILSGRTSNDEHSAEPFLADSSVLLQILNAQRRDPVGLREAFRLYDQLPASVQQDLCNKWALARRGSLGKKPILDAQSTSRDVGVDEARSLVERYLLAATVKDCSVMVSLRKLKESAAVSPSKSSQVVRVKTATGETASFVYSVKILDLDPKSPKNLTNAHNRYMEGVRLLESNPSLRAPCVARAAYPGSRASDSGIVE